MIDMIRVGQTRNLLRASSSLSEIWTRSAHHHPGQRRQSAARTGLTKVRTRSHVQKFRKSLQTERHPQKKVGYQTHPIREIACRGTGKLLINEPALDKLQALRDRLGKPLIVRSAYRSPEHNRAVGGATRSKHLDGAAFDIAMANHDPVAFEAAAREVGFLGFGFYPRSGFIRVDLGPARQWGERFPIRATAFAAETPPAREVLAEKVLARCDKLRLVRIGLTLPSRDFASWHKV